MRIVQTPVRFFPAIGGVEKYVLDLSLQLVRRGHYVTVICSDEPKSDVSVQQGIRVKRLGYVGKVANTNITPLLLAQLMGEDFDLIHTHMPTPWSAEFSLLAARLKRKPCILTYHNDVEKKGLMGIFTRVYNATLLQIILQGVDRILITQPHYLRDSRFLWRFRGKIVVIPNGLSCLPALEQSSRRATSSLLFVGLLDRYHRYKGLDYLIRALTFLKRDWPAIRLDVVGKGELISEYSNLAERLDVRENVHFHGYVSDEALETFYRSNTVFVLPSVDTHEGFGIVLLEAMAHELPVVTTRVVGLSNEIEEHSSGLIVPEKDASALAQAIHQVLCDPAEMGQRGRTLVEQKYLWSEICESVERVYAEAIR